MFFDLSMISKLHRLFLSLEKYPRKIDKSLFFIVLSLQTIFLCISFPITQLFSEAPLNHTDALFHWYQIDVAKELWQDRNLIGYDPWFAAGHMGGVNYNASAKFPALLAILLSPWLSTIVAYKLHVFIAALVAPSLVLLALRWLNANSVATLSGTVLGFLLWWISALHWYHTVGMVSYVLASYASLPYIALTWRNLTQTIQPLQIIVLGVAGAFGLFYHPLFPIPIVFTLPVLVVLFWQQVNYKQLVIVFITLALLSLLPNLPWLVLSIKFPGWSDGNLSPYQKIVDIHIIWSEALGRIEGAARGARLNPVMWFCVCWALFGETNRTKQKLAISFVFSASLLLIFAAVGAALPIIATLQPNRLSTAGYLLMIIPASFGISTLTQLFTEKNYIGHFAKASLAVLSVTLLFFVNEFRHEISTDNVGHYGTVPPEVTGFNASQIWLKNWLQANTNEEGRILFETLGADHNTGHIAGFLAKTTQREFIGGPYVFMHHAGFWDGYAFGQMLSKLSSEELSKKLTLYNISWIVVRSESAKNYFASQPDVIEQAHYEKIKIYAVKHKPSFFLEGRGKVIGRKRNKIIVADVEGASITLKYHYAEGMYTEPKTTLEPVYQLDDPKPFIRVLNPQPTLSIIYPGH